MVQLWKNDNVGGFDTKWDEVLLSMKKSSRCISLYIYMGTLEQEQLLHSGELKTLMALYLQDSVQK